LNPACATALSFKTVLSLEGPPTYRHAAVPLASVSCLVYTELILFCMVILLSR
jgi:hypothetical protein